MTDSPDGRERATLESYWLLLDDLEIHREELRLRGDQLAEAQSAIEAIESFLADAPFGYVILDGKGTIRDCNQVADRMLEVDPTGAHGWSLTAFVAPEHQRRFTDHFLKCRTGEGPVRTELALKTRTGTRLCQLVTRRTFVREGEWVFRTAILDLTDRKKIEQALAATERRLAAAVEASGAGVFEIELPFAGHLYLSQKLLEFLGYSRADLGEPAGLPSWLDDHLHAGDRDELIGHYREISDGGRDSCRCDVRFRHKDGFWRWIRIWAKATPLGETGSRALVGAAMDVSADKERSLEAEGRARQLHALATELFQVEERERRKLATELHDNLAQLIVATKMKLHMIAPSGNARLIAREVEEAMEFLDRADQSVRSLTFSLSPPVLDELGLTPAVKWLATDMAKQFGLEVELKAEGEFAIADPRLRFMLFRSIRELLINAAKHGDTKHATVILEEGRGGFRVMVEDKGKGFDSEQAREEAPHGFGLFSIQERVQSLGGKMKVRSAPGQGTAVVILLENGKTLGTPVKPYAVLPESSGLSAPQSRGERIRVLLADDHELIRSALARLLDAQSDVEVIGEASDGESAVELAHRLVPDVVLMDVTMAGMGGIEATRRISAEHPQARVIGLSMHESSDIASAMMTAGAFDFLRKSSPTQALLDTIRRAARDSR